MKRIVLVSLLSMVLVSLAVAVIAPVSPSVSRAGLSVAQPDLVIEVNYRGRPAIVEDLIEIPFKVTVRNIGRAAAGIFYVSADYEIVSGMRADLLRSGWIGFAVPGYGVTLNTNAPLPPGGHVTFDGKIVFSARYGGTRVKFRAVADALVVEFTPVYGFVRESNENNNATPWMTVDLPASFTKMR